MAVQGVSRLTTQNFSKVRFRLPGSASWIETSCKVAWMSEAQDVAGVEFDDLGDLERSQIRSWSDRMGQPEPWAGDSGTSRRTVTMELPLTRAASVGEESMFRSESWVREPYPGSYGRGFVVWAVIAAAAALLLLGLRWGWGTKLLGPKAGIAARVIERAEGTADSQAGAPEAAEEPAPPASSTAVKPSVHDQAADFGTAPAGEEFIVQVGAMRVRGNADALAKKLQADKFPTVQFSGRDGLNVVAVGPFADENSAQAARQSLRDQGFDGILRKLPAR
jgi:cell division septation protein DedD